MWPSHCVAESHRGMWHLSALEMLLDPLVSLGDLDVEFVHSTIEPTELLVLLTL